MSRSTQQSGLKTQVLGLRLWARCGLVVILFLGVFLGVLLFTPSAGGALDPYVWIRAAGGEALNGHVLRIVALLSHGQTAISAATIICAVVSLFLAGKPGWRWRSIVLVGWFVMSPPMMLIVYDGMFSPATLWGARPGTLLAGIVATASMAIVLVTFPSMPVRVTWAIWWVYAILAPQVLAMIYGAAPRLFDSIGPRTAWAMPVAMLIWAVLHRRSIIAPGHCRRCRYDLSATDEALPCPECGAMSSRAIG